MRKVRDTWTARDTDSAAQLTLPLLQALERDQPKALQALSDALGRDRTALERGLRYLCSRGLAHRREERHPPKMRFAQDGWEVTKERVIRRWILSQRGKDYRDRLQQLDSLEREVSRG